MGIPKYFRWVVNKYSNLKINKENKDLVSIDNLFLDANGLIHPCVRKVLVSNFDLIDDHFHQYNNNIYNIQNTIDIYSKLEKKMFIEILNYIRYLCDFVCPSKLLYIAIDGIAPRAKMEQQKLRRYRSQMEKKIINRLKLKHKIPIQKEWDTNSITPGTTFMLKLSNYIQKNIRNFLKKSKYNFKILLSDTSRPGEGEHKIVEYIRTNIVESEINSIYGLDADLIMLSLCIDKQIYLLRESIHFGNIKSDELLYFDIKQFKENIFKEIELEYTNVDFEIDNRVIIDYVFLCFLFGNDFIPHITQLEISNNGINFVFQIYIKMLSIKKHYLINENEIDFNFLRQILNQIFNNEDKMLKEIQKKINYRKIYKKNYENEFEKEKDLLRYYPIMKKNKLFNLQLGSKDWRDRYYYYYFNINNTNNSKEFVQSICKKYIEGLQWNLKYYLTEGCPSWKWFYPYRAAPCLRDLCSYLNKRIYKINFIPDLPYKPIQQLTLVLPKSSRYLLPKEYQILIESNNINIIQYYPNEFVLDTVNKIWFHECEPILPVINDSILTFFDKIHLNEFDKCKNIITDKDIDLT